MELKSAFKSKNTAHPFRKKLLKWLSIALLVILTLEFVVYFGSNIFLTGIIRTKLNQSTNSVYEIGFNRLNLSLIRRGLFLNGIVMKPIHSENSKADQFLFEFTLDKVSFSGLWFDFFDKELSVSKIHLDNPNLSLIQSESENLDEPAALKDSSRKSSIKILENELKKSLNKIYLNGFFVDRIEIDHANFFFLNFLSKGELKAKNTSVVALNLDWTTTEDWNTPFNAKGFEFELDEVVFPLRDGVHTLKSNQVSISSLDKTIYIREFSLVPDLTKKNPAYYHLDLERLRIGNVDLNKAFMTSELEMDELIMDKPVIKVVKSTFPFARENASGDLNDLIQGHLKSVSIKELSINQASFLKKNREDSLKNRIQLDGLDFKMVGFYLGDNADKKKDQFFYGQDASMEIQESKLYLGDGMHILEGKEVGVSSFKDELIVSDLSVYPIQDILISRTAKNLIKIRLRGFSLVEADLKYLYQTGELKVDQVLIDQPDIEITELNSDPKNSLNVSFAEVIAGFLNQVTVRDFRVNEGKVLFKDTGGQRSNNIGFEKFSLSLDQLDLLPNTNLPIQDQFKAQHILLTLKDYRLKLKDNLHLILADELSIDSKKSLLEVKNLSVKPEDSDQVPALLDAYGKNIAVDFSVPLFRALGMNVKEALFNRKLRIREIRLPNPNFQVYNYNSASKNEGKEKLNSAEDIKELLLGYFDEIRIDSISLDRAKIRYESIIDSKRSLFQEDDLSLKMKQFKVALGDSLDLNRSLFSEEINLTFNNYSFSLAGGRYLAETEYLNYNSKAKTIEMNHLVLSPGALFSNRVSLELNFPKVNLLGVDLEDFIFEGYLNLQKLEVEKGDIEIGIDRKFGVVANSRLRRNRVLKKAVDEINIDTVTALNSTLRLNYLGQNQSLQSIRTGFDLFITDFNLDTLMVDAQDFSGAYDLANLDLKDFEFALPDSVHTLKFSSLALGDKKDELIFSDFSIIPKDYAGVSGNPVIEAKIEQLALQKNKLQEMLDSKVLDLKELRLKNSVLDLYLDSEERKLGQNSVREKKENKLLESIVLEDLILENSSVKVHRKGQSISPMMNFPVLDLKISGLGVDLLNVDRLPNLKDLAKKNVSFNLSGYEYSTPDSLYQARFGRINYHSGNIAVEDVRFRPSDGLYGYLRSQPHQKDAVEGSVDFIFVRGWDPAKWVDQNWLVADEVLVQGAKVDLFRDKRIPMDSNAYRPMPQFLLEEARFNADLLSVRIRDSKIRYFEFPSKGIMPGMISFDSVQMDMAPFFMRKKEGNYPLEKVRLGIQAKLMNSSKLQLEAQMYFTEDYPMDVRVEMGPFDFRQASDFLSKSLFVQASQGSLTQGLWEFRLNDNYAVGQMGLGYKDLKLQFLDSLTLEQGKGKIRFLSFGANFLAKNSNPRSASGSLIRREIYVKRDKRKFIFNAWWRSTLSGIRATVGFGRAKLPKEIRREEEDSQNEK